VERSENQGKKTGLPKVARAQNSLIGLLIAGATIGCHRHRNRRVAPEGKLEHFQFSGKSPAQN
jgi:hypothetical protein